MALPLPCEPAATLAEALATESLSTSEWARLLGMTPRAIQLRKLPAERRVVRGGMTWAIRFGDLPQDWQQRLAIQK